MTFEPLTIERFRILADAYGGVVARWPENITGEALRLSRTEAGRTILAEALALDETLDLWQVPVPDVDFAGRIVAGAPTASKACKAKLWWTGFGIAAALSGATAGVAATAAISPASHIDSMTVFGDLPAGSDDRG
ncbi:hypothetical protein [Sphingomonas sp. PAMC 26617]|uniref:hypothetical protein n=1 Tax=Sphingomonas sp. PAMC 26617 TaxID=1112216 RepID=UPI0002888FD4|nr:hypothetical protein [Sphingomonas sp. PAMC 26617]